MWRSRNQHEVPPDSQLSRCQYTDLLPCTNTADETKKSQYPAYKPCHTPETICGRGAARTRFLTLGVVQSVHVVSTAYIPPSSTFQWCRMLTKVAGRARHPSVHVLGGGPRRGRPRRRSRWISSRWRCTRPLAALNGKVAFGPCPEWCAPERARRRRVPGRGGRCWRLQRAGAAHGGADAPRRRWTRTPPCPRTSPPHRTSMLPTRRVWWRMISDNPREVDRRADDRRAQGRRPARVSSDVGRTGTARRAGNRSARAQAQRLGRD